jgi:hypothetical protein
MEERRKILDWCRRGKKKKSRSEAKVGGRR